MIVTVWRMLQTTDFTDAAGEGVLAKNGGLGTCIYFFSVP